jgi:hypothetical protein
MYEFSHSQGLGRVKSVWERDEVAFANRARAFRVNLL